MSEGSKLTFLVLLYNAASDECAVTEHNLTLKAARAEAEYWRVEGFPAFTIPQLNHHDNTDAAECGTCRAEIRRWLNPRFGPLPLITT